MAFSSLADELAGAFDNDPSLDQGDGIGLGQSLADEFGLDYGLEHNLEHAEAGDEFDVGIQHPSTPPGRNDSSPKPITPPQNGRRTAKSSYEPTNLDDISPNRGIDLDLELELEYGQNHSFSTQPDFQDEEDSDNYEYEQDQLDNLPLAASPVRVRGIQSKSSLQSLRVNPKSSVRSLRLLNGNEKEEGIQEALIVLSEGVSTNSRLLDSLRQINQHHQGEGEEDVEIRLQRHLNKMNEVERTRDEWIRDLGIWSREVGLGGLEANGRLGDADDKLIDVDEEEEEEEEEEGESLGWTGESIVDDNNHSSRGEEMSNYPRIALSHEDDHINSHDSLLLDEVEHESFPTYPSDQSLMSPITPSKHHRPAQDLPKLIMAIQKDTDILLTSLRNLQDTIHTTTSFHTSLARMMKGIRSSIDSYRERENVEEQARRKIEEWEAERLKIGLTRNNAGGGEEGWTIKEKLDRECREFEDVLERYGDRLKGLKEGSRRVGVAA